MLNESHNAHLEKPQRDTNKKMKDEKKDGEFSDSLYPRAEDSGRNPLREVRRERTLR